MRKENTEGESQIRELMTAKRVAQILGISAKTVNKLVREGKLGYVQVTAKERRFAQQQIQDYVESRTKIIRVDRERGRSVSSEPKKGGEQGRRTKSFEAQVTGSLVEELKALCR